MRVVERRENRLGKLAAGGERMLIGRVEATNLGCAQGTSSAEGDRVKRVERRQPRERGV